ncbi:MAG: cobaltochelatase subunit CobN [Pseudomonadota bacterium]
MHILAAQPGRIDDGAEAIDLGQTPGEIVFVSAADTDLSGLAAAAHGAGEAAAGLRLANLMMLSHPFSVDLYADQTLTAARLIVVRLLGGKAYWPYGVERLTEVARGAGADLVIVPGDDKWDVELTALSTVAPEEARALWRYFAEGGPDNLARALQWMLHRAGQAEMPEPAIDLPRAGLIWPGQPGLTADTLPILWSDPTRPFVPIIVYRSLVQSSQTEPVAALIKALSERALNPLPIFVASLKDAVCAAFVDDVFARFPPSVVLNTTAFALSVAGRAHEPTVLDRPGRPVLQVVLSGTSSEAWRDSDQGLAIRDLAMHVVLPEVDGRVLTRAVSFKEPAPFDPLTQSTPVRQVPEPGRIAFVADLARALCDLGVTPPDRRKVALVLANYPTKDGRIANGVGLDTPASAVAILMGLKAAGYDVGDAPETSEALMDQILAGPTNRFKTAPESLFSMKALDGEIRFSISAYRKVYETLTEAVRARMEARWGQPEDDPGVDGDAFVLAAHRFGNVIVGIQPARGYNIDPKETYHDPDLVPPHGYLAFYAWLRSGFGAQAVIHTGKHGNLEWLPGKALALGDTCFPEAMLGPLPNIYPFIVNDPGEGCQAKRRTSAVIVDHLTPPMTRAESHGVAVALETLIDEYYLASGVDPRRTTELESDIADLALGARLNEDVGLPADIDRGTLLQRVDAHLCDLKELQIRDGLHVLGQAPDGDQLTDLLVAIARVPRGEGIEHASLHRAVAADLGLGTFDPLDCAMAEAWDGPKPDVLSAQSDALWRSAGDTVERIELLAARLVSGDVPPNTDWTATRAVLDWINDTLRPAVLDSGEAELAAVLAGLDARFVEPGPSGAPTRGRPDVLPTGRNFYAVDVRAVPTETAWRIGAKSAKRLVERYVQDEGDWPEAFVLTCWGTANMRTGGDDIAQALALIGAKPVWEPGSGRVTGFEIVKLSELGRPRVDVTLRISGFFRDAFPHQIDLFDSAVQAIADLDEPDDANPIAARVRREAETLRLGGMNGEVARRRAGYRVFGSMPGAYGAGLQALIDEHIWSERSDFADAFLAWGGFAYGGGAQGSAARSELEARLAKVDAVVQNQDNREHDLLDSDDYYQFEGGLAATVEALKGAAPRIFHNDHSRPERPVIRSLEEEIARVVRGRAANPKWIQGVMRHGYKGAFEIAATVDYLFAFAATTHAVRDHQFDQLFEAYVQDEVVDSFIADANPPARIEIAERFLEAIERGLWTPRLNSARETLQHRLQNRLTDGVALNQTDTHERETA